MNEQPSADELGREYLRALQAKDKQAIFAIISEDFELEVPLNLSGTNDYSDNWRGLDAANTNYDTTFRIIQDLVYPDLEFTSGSDPNIAFAEGPGTMMMANGRPYRNRYIFRFDARNGKLWRIREYTNPITSAVAFGLPLPQSSDDGVSDQFV
ncbi:MAG: nuclear transport factor 2 family protein [Novosphingobium sp.]|nr:nuclear transport factor 2 family protein [Novosphingobium sp.]